MRLSSWRITTTTSSPAWTWTRSTWRSTRTWWGWGKECMLIMLRRGGIDFLRGQILRGKHLDCGRDCPRLPNSWIPVHKYKAAAVPADPWRRFVQLLPAAQSCWEFAGNYSGAGVWLWSSSELSHGQQFLWETQFFEGNKWIRLRLHRSCKSDLMGDVKKIWGWYRKCSQNRGTDISVKKLSPFSSWSLIILFLMKTNLECEHHRFPPCRPDLPRGSPLPQEIPKQVTFTLHHF